MRSDLTTLFFDKPYTLLGLGAYLIDYLAKSPETHIGAGGHGTLAVDFVIGGSGTAPSDGTSLEVEVLARSGTLTYFAGRQFVTWHPTAS